MDTQPTDIYAYVMQEETAYQLPINVNDKWQWGMKEHVETTMLYKYSQLTGDKKKGTIDEKPVKNIIRPILNLQYRAEGFDVKDITLFVNSSDDYYKSFLVQKYHDRYALEHHIDTAIDESVESYIDYGGALLKKTKDGPEVVPWQMVAFCDQTDILSGPIALKHQFSPDQLLDQAELGWGEEKNGANATLEEVITLAQSSRTPDKQTGTANKTPGKYIEVYELHGTLPSRYLNPDAKDDERYTPQLQIVTFYTGTDGKKKGITLFRGKETTSPFKLILRDKIYGRALGFGGAEELFEAQIWTNYAKIRAKDMLDAAAKMLLITQDPTLAAKHPSGLKNLDNMEVIEEMANGNTRLLDTFPRNMQLFDNSVKEWEDHAQQMGAATDALLGEDPSSGTPFQLQNLVVQQGQGLHEYRQGKLAEFWAGVYRDWIIPDIVKELAQGQEFLSDLSLDELQQVADSLVTIEANKLIKQKIFVGQVIDPTQVETYKQQVRDQFMKGGSKRFIRILDGELKNAPMDVEVNVVGKQKQLSQMVDKLTNIMRFVFSTYNPQTGSFAALDDPRMVKTLNQILEFSGLSPIDYGSTPPKSRQGSYPQSPTGQQNQPQAQPSPMQLPASQPSI